MKNESGSFYFLCCMTTLFLHSITAGTFLTDPWFPPCLLLYIQPKCDMILIVYRNLPLLSNLNSR